MAPRQFFRHRRMQIHYPPGYYWRLLDLNVGLTWTALVKKTPASLASFFTLKSMVLHCADHTHRACLFPCGRESSDQLRYCGSRRRTGAVIRFVDDRKSALRPAIKETTAPGCKSRLPSDTLQYVLSLLDDLCSCTHGIYTDAHTESISILSHFISDKPESIKPKPCA